MEPKPAPEWYWRVQASLDLLSRRTVLLDLIIDGGDVISGSAASVRRADIGAKDGKIAYLGRLGEEVAARRVDVTGYIVAPEIVDIHTLYDRQIMVDPEVARGR